MREELFDERIEILKAKKKEEESKSKEATEANYRFASCISKAANILIAKNPNLYV